MIETLSTFKDIKDENPNLGPFPHCKDALKKDKCRASLKMDCTAEKQLLTKQYKLLSLNDTGALYCSMTTAKHLQDILGQKECFGSSKNHNAGPTQSQTYKSFFLQSECCRQPRSTQKHQR